MVGINFSGLFDSGKEEMGLFIVGFLWCIGVKRRKSRGGADIFSCLIQVALASGDGGRKVFLDECGRQTRPGLKNPRQISLIHADATRINAVACKNWIMSVRLRV